MLIRNCSCTTERIVLWQWKSVFLRSFQTSSIRWNSLDTTMVKASKLHTIFNDKNWALQRPRIEKFETIPLDFTLKKGQEEPIFFREYPDIKKGLQLALEHVYTQQVRSNHSKEFQIKNTAWIKLNKHISEQLTQYKTPPFKTTYNDLLFDFILPERSKTNLLTNIINVDLVDSRIWNKLLSNETQPSKQDKLNFLLSQCYRYIYQQETFPLSAPLDDTDTVDTVDILNPAQWFSETRKMKRHIIMHLGPTNSGKTYRALQRLKQVERGYYGGPLRLLAREVHDKFQKDGVRCNLLTGEEIIEDLDPRGNKAGITSGTIEMIPLNTKFDVVVLDEIQMMSDPDRGWAWTNALLGVQAREVHVCGEPSTYRILEKIVQMTGDKLTLNEYDRLGRLNVEKSSIKRNYKDLRKGDCIVAFSKKKILDLKLDIERKTDFKVSVIYGSLPPETRVQQANLFNSGEYDILIASDAIGMGLNLSIDRIIFTTSKKFNGSEMMQLTNSQIKQIGGRAGRFKSNKTQGESIGYISAMDGKTLEAIRSGMEAPMTDLEKVIIWPTDEICSQLMIRYPPGTNLSFLLTTLAERLEQDESGIFELSDLGNKLAAISMFEHMEDISFFDKLRLSTAPVKDTPLVKKAFIEFCETIAKGETRGLLSFKLPFHYLTYNCIPDESVGLEKYESLYNIIMLFFWLSNRYPEYFVDIESAKDLKLFCELIIFEKLDRLKRNPYMFKFQAN